MSRRYRNSLKAIQNRMRHEKEVILRETPLAIQQKLLDLLHSGKSVGEAREECGLSLNAACAILEYHLVTVEHSYLKKRVDE